MVILMNRSYTAFVLVIVVLLLLIAALLFRNSKAQSITVDCATPVPVLTQVATTVATVVPTVTVDFRSGGLLKYPETNNLVVYATIKNAAGKYINDYRIRFIKDGATLVGESESTSFVQGETHKAVIINNIVEPSDIPSYFYNYKQAFDPMMFGEGFNPAGTWKMALNDWDGKQVSEWIEFVIAEDDPNMEFYIEFIGLK